MLMPSVFGSSDGFLLVQSPYLYNQATLTWRIEQPRGREPSRKVRTSKGEVVGNADPGKPAGKCHRNHTA